MARGRLRGAGALDDVVASSASPVSHPMPAPTAALTHRSSSRSCFEAAFFDPTGRPRFLGGCAGRLGAPPRAWLPWRLRPLPGGLSEPSVENPANRRRAFAQLPAHLQHIWGLLRWRRAHALAGGVPGFIHGTLVAAQGFTRVQAHHDKNGCNPAKSNAERNSATEVQRKSRSG